MYYLHKDFLITNCQAFVLRNCMMVNILMTQPSGFVIKDSIMQKGLFIPVGTKVIWQKYIRP